MATYVKFDGPEGMVNRDVGAETGDGDLLKPGKIYAVSAELAERLLEHAHWKRPTTAERKRAAGGSSSSSRTSSRAAADPAETPAGDGADSVPGDTVEGDAKP